MAWRCSGSNNQELLANMRAAGLVQSTSVAQAMTKVDRKWYVPEGARDAAYVDSPQSIGYGATISAPHMHAHAAEALLPYMHKGARVLDIGSGSGYTMAIFWHIVKPNGGTAGNDVTASQQQHQQQAGKVVGVDHLKPLVQMAKDNLRKDGLGDVLDKGDIEVIHGDGRLGYPSRGPYSAIHVGAASTGIPDALIDQLAQPGRMFIPVADPSSGGQHIYHVDKDKDGRVTKERQFGVMYVPLTDAKSQWPTSED